MIQKSISVSARAVGPAACTCFPKREKGEYVRFHCSKGIAILALFIALILSGAPPIWGQLYSIDEVWYKLTDQIEGFGDMGFSLNDSIIVGSGKEMCLFFKTENGDEIIRIPGHNPVYYINNDNNFIRLNDSNRVIELFDAKNTL